MIIKKKLTILIVIIILIIILGFLGLKRLVRQYIQENYDSQNYSGPALIETERLWKEYSNLLQEKIRFFGTIFQDWCGDDCIYQWTNCNIKVEDPQGKEIFHRIIEKCDQISDIVTDREGNFYFYDYHLSPIYPTRANLYKYDRSKRDLLEIPDIPLSEATRCGLVGHKLYYNEMRDTLWITYLEQTFSEGGHQTAREICELNLKEIMNLKDFREQNLKNLGSQRAFDSKVDGKMGDFEMKITNTDEAIIFWQGIFYPEGYPKVVPIHRVFRQQINILTGQKTEKEEIREVSPKASEPEIGIAIKTYCRNRYWPSDFNTRTRCEKEQFESVRILNQGRPIDISESDFNIIRVDCFKEWPTDFVKRADCEKQRFDKIRAK